MAFYMNDLVQEACEDLNLTGIGEAVEGRLAAAAEGCVNRAIAQLNGDGYMSLTKHVYDTMAAGPLHFRKLEAGESKSNTVDIEPPDAVEAVARKVGLRWMRLRPTSREVLDRTLTYSYPTGWSYGVDMETAPSGAPRQVGILYLNGNYPAELRVYVNSQLPKYKLGETIYLSGLYRNLILYATEMKLVELNKLKSYEARVQVNLNGAMKMIDIKHTDNSPDTPDQGPEGSYMDCYCDIIGGVGF